MVEPMVIKPERFRYPQLVEILESDQTMIIHISRKGPLGSRPSQLPLININKNPIKTANVLTLNLEPGEALT